MPEVGGQPGQERFGVQPGPVPAEQGADRETVPEIVDPGPDPGAGPDPRRGDRLTECLAEMAVGDRGSRQRDEQPRRRGAPLVALPGVCRQRADRPCSTS